MRAVLVNAQQGHIAMQEVWQYCKAQLTAGKRVVLEAKLEKRSGAQNRRYWGNGVLKQQLIEECITASEVLEMLSNEFEVLGWVEHASYIQTMASHIRIYSHQIAAKEEVKR